MKACMESTDCYSEALAEFLNNARSNLVRQKNDQIDAEITQIIAKGRRWTPPFPELKKLKHLYRCSAALKDELTLVNNHLEKKERLPKEVLNYFRHRRGISNSYLS